MLRISSLRVYILQAFRRDVIFVLPFFLVEIATLNFFSFVFGFKMIFQKIKFFSRVWCACSSCMCLSPRSGFPANYFSGHCGNLGFWRALFCASVWRACPQWPHIYIYIYIYMCIYIYIYINALVKDMPFSPAFLF